MVRRTPEDEAPDRPGGPVADATRTDVHVDTFAHDSSNRAYVMVHRGDETRLVPLEPGAEIVVGRAANADVRVDDDRVSRRNTSIANVAGAVVVRDLGSRNGTRVDGDVIRNAVASTKVGTNIVVGSVRVSVAGLGRGKRATASEGGGAPLPVVADAKTQALFDRVRKLAPLPTYVLLVGETGVGKEVLVETLHAASRRAAGPLVRVNCAALAPTLIEAELFGHESGAFTGAARRRVGLLEAASGGTLFLDEIGELDIGLQAKLLRAIESQRVVRLGGRDEIVVDVRLVSATNRDLAGAIREGRFRSDLYYRIAGFVLDVPPLRERPGDIGPLAQHFLGLLAARAGLPVPPFTPAALEALEAHAWPGNARELRNAIEHALVVCEGEAIGVHHLPAFVTAPVGDATAALAEGSGAGMRDRVAELERESILAALAAAGGHQGRAAEALGISRRALVYKLGKYGLRGA